MTTPDGFSSEPGFSPDPAPSRLNRPLRDRVVSGALWVGASTILLRFGNIAIMAIVVRIVTPQDFGTFAVAVSVQAVVGSLGMMGLLAILARADLDLDAIAPTTKTLALFSGAIAAVVLASAAGPIGSAMGAPEAAGAIRVMSLGVLLTGVYAAPGAILARELRQDQIFFANVLAFFPMNALLVVLAVYGDGALAFAWSRVFGQLIAGALMTYFARRTRYRFGFERAEARFVLRAGLPVAGADLLTVLLMNVDYVFVAGKLGTHELGLYVLAFNVANWSTWVLSAVLSGIGVAAFSRAKVEGTLDSWVAGTQRMVAFLAWPACALSAASARPLIETIYGKDWSDAAIVLAILAPYAVLLTHSVVFSQVLTGSGRAGSYLAIQISWMVVLVPALWIGEALGGASGVAFAHVIVICGLVIPLNLVMFRRLEGIRPTSLLVAVLPALPGVVIASGVDLLASTLVDPPWEKLVLGVAAGGIAFLVVSAGQMIETVPVANGRLVLRFAHAVLAVADRPRRLVVSLASEGVLGRRTGGGSR